MDLFLYLVGLFVVIWIIVRTVSFFLSVLGWFVPPSYVPQRPRPWYLPPPEK
jgi:hypothetical protein